MSKNLVPSVASIPGTVVRADDALAVNVAGTNLADILWPGGYTPRAGDTVRVLRIDGRAEVLGPRFDSPRAVTGTAQTATDGRVTVIDDFGNTLRCRYTGSAPGSGARVRIDWQSAEPWVWPGAVAATPDDSDFDGSDAPAPPPVNRSGTLSVIATASGSYRTSYGRWEPGVVRQGAWGASPNRGAWFYGSGARQLAGATITRIQMRLGARLRLGNHNAVYPANFWLATGGPGNWSRSSQHNVNVAVNYPGGWIDLPVGWANALIGGAGVGIDGTFYGGFQGVNQNAASGQLIFHWRR